MELVIAASFDTFLNWEFANLLWPEVGQSLPAFDS
jgi:hypothetical protein